MALIQILGPFTVTLESGRELTPDELGAGVGDFVDIPNGLAVQAVRQGAARRATLEEVGRPAPPAAPEPKPSASRRRSTPKPEPEAADAAPAEKES